MILGGTTMTMAVTMDGKGGRGRPRRRQRRGRGRRRRWRRRGRRGGRWTRWRRCPSTRRRRRGSGGTPPQNGGKGLSPARTWWPRWRSSGMEQTTRPCGFPKWRKGTQPSEDVVAKVEKFRHGANYTAMWLPKMEERDSAQRGRGGQGGEVQAWSK